MSEETRDMLLEQLKGTRESLNELWERIDHWTSEGSAYVDECYKCQQAIEDSGYDDPNDELLERPLEIVWETGEPFAVVLGTGGPHVEIRGGTRHDGSSYSLHGYWSGEHVVISGESITRTGEYFRELVEES